MNHVKQVIYTYHSISNLELQLDLSIIGERMLLEYIRMFQNIHEVYYKIKPNNVEFTRKNLFQTLSIIDQLDRMSRNS
ncbi:MAG: hypothetical protein U1V55_12110 [Planktothrix rubescens PR222]